MWKSTHAVPVPFIYPPKQDTLPALPTNFAFNRWIKPPPSPPNFLWTRISKQTPSHLIHYMSGRPTSNPNNIKYIDNILLLKLEDGYVINIKNDDINNALQVIKLIL